MTEISKYKGYWASGALCHTGKDALGRSGVKDDRMRLDISYHSIFQRAVLALGLIGLLAAAGCGDKGPKINVVNGSVNVDSKPAAGVMVVFCPVNAPPEIQRMRPFGITQADGKFQLTAAKKGDGAPTGQFKVLFQWPTSANDTGAGVQLGADRFQGRFMNLEKTQFTVDIKPGENDLPPFELKSK